jgi:YidC/Oxa1 family membrane protein insertase
MDFGVGFLSNNVMLPILDFFYGIVPSYGLAIVALTLVIRFALYPLSAGSIRNMRRMKVAQPAMQKRVKEVQERHKDDPAKQQEEMSKVYKEFGNPLAGCFPVLLQMPILFALFATLRGSPFSDVPYNINLQVLPKEQIEQVAPQAYVSKPQNIYVADGTHIPVAAVIPGGDHLAIGEKTHIDFQTTAGKPLTEVLAEYPDSEIKPTWKITKGENLVKFDENGNLEAVAPGDVTIQGSVPGIASNKGFLFITALGRVGAFGENGAINWDILGMVVFFGISLYISQLISGQGASDNPQQAAVNKFTPVIFSGMFLFFPLPAGVLMYMVIANIFQTAQTFILSREPLPENLQKIVDAEEKKKASGDDRASLPFEPKAVKKEEAPKKETPKKDGGADKTSKKNKKG